MQVKVTIPAVGDKPAYSVTKEISVPTITCPVGQFLDPITNTCKPIVCPAGQFLDPITKTCKPIVCPVGEYLDPYTLTCKPIVCPVGEYLDPITKTCKPLVCPVGEYLDPYTLTCKPIKCPAGEYLDPITKTCKPIVCPVGEYLDPYTLTCKPIKCPVGEYLDPVTKTCKPIKCPAGQYLDPITNTCKPIVCPVGEYLDPVTKTCKPLVCPVGEYLDPITLTCVPVTPKEVCQIGYVRKIRCPDGSEIVIEKCEKDPTTGRNRWVPTGNTCPPLEMGKIVKILTYPEGAALEAFDGQEVTVTASVVCGLTLSSGETATFEVDGAEVARGTTSSGTVSFKWKATVEPSRTHKLCVSVPKSAQCPKYGSARDCKTITVSRIIPGIEEQLIKEREEYAKGIEALRQEQERIRELIQPAISAIPIVPYIPAIPFIPTIPTVPTVPEVPEVPKLGKISIPSVEIPFGVEYPVIIYIDGERIGSPPVLLDADPGTHTVRIELKGFTPISKKISVIAGETTVLTGLRFV